MTNCALRIASDESPTCHWSPARWAIATVPVTCIDVSFWGVAVGSSKRHGRLRIGEVVDLDTWPDLHRSEDDATDESLIHLEILVFKEIWDGPSTRPTGHLVGAVPLLPAARDRHRRALRRHGHASSSRIRRVLIRSAASEALYVGSDALSNRPQLTNSQVAFNLGVSSPLSRYRCPSASSNLRRTRVGSSNRRQVVRSLVL